MRSFLPKTIQASYETFLSSVRSCIESAPQQVCGRQWPLLPAIPPAGIAKLAVLSDGLRLICLINECQACTAETIAKLNPWIDFCRRKLESTGRKEYQTLSSQKQFLDCFRSDIGLFGGACRRTEWLGLAIALNSAKLSEDADILKSYCRFVSPILQLDPEQETTWFFSRLIGSALNEVTCKGDADSCDADVCLTDGADDNQPAYAPSDIVVQGAFTDHEITITLGPVPGPALFGYTEESNRMSLILNSLHPLAESLRDLVMQNGSSHRGVTELLHAWVKLENSAGNARRRLLEDIRYDWGRFANRKSQD